MQENGIRNVWGGPEENPLPPLNFSLCIVFVLPNCFPRSKSQAFRNSSSFHLYRINVSMRRQPTKPTLPIHCTQYLNKTMVCFRPSLGLDASNRIWIGNGDEGGNRDRMAWGREVWTWKRTNNHLRINREGKARVLPLRQIFSWRYSRRIS